MDNAERRLTAQKLKALLILLLLSHLHFTGEDVKPGYPLSRWGWAFVHTDMPEAPWHVVEGDDKRRGRLNCIAHLLSMVPYEDVIETPLELPPRPSSTGYERPPREFFRYVPDHAATLG